MLEIITDGAEVSHDFNEMYTAVSIWKHRLRICRDTGTRSEAEKNQDLQGHEDGTQDVFLVGN